MSSSQSLVRASKERPTTNKRSVRFSTVVIACALHLVLGIHIGRGTLSHYGRIAFPVADPFELVPALESLDSDALHEKPTIQRKSTTISATTSTTLSDSPLPASPTTTLLESPVFSLSLPNTGVSILPRYFQCAGYQEQFGRYWTHTHPGSKQRRPIGSCLSMNMKVSASRKRSLLKECGNFTIWHELQYREAPSYLAKKPQGQEGKCFDPVLYPGALEKLYQAAPKAAIVVMIRDPKQWYKTLSYDLHMQWNQWCNPIHNNSFPTNDTEEEYISFFLYYHGLIKDFVQSHPGWNLIEINLEDSNSKKTAKMLQSLWGIESKCWMEAVQGNIPVYDQQQKEDDGSVTVTGSLPRPNDITYPILTVSMPKSGTTTVDTYFKCNLGKWAATHQWTKNSSRPPFKHISIGDCMKDNVNAGRPLLKDCGFARVYTDIGTIPSQTCYYAQLQGGLENFAEAYPHATLLLTVRNATSWVSSLKRWNTLDRRLAKSPGCQDLFPSPDNANIEEWEAFYYNHLEYIRKFVQDHPTLTYIEVPLTDKAGPMMDDVFGFQKACWGHENANTGVMSGDQIKKSAPKRNIAV